MRDATAGVQQLPPLVPVMLLAAAPEDEAVY